EEQIAAMGLLGKITGAVVKRLPAHGRDRLEDFLLPRRGFERLVVPRRPALTIVCDDGEAKDLDIVEVLERHGVKGVFAVSPALIGQPGFLGYEALRQIRAAGHEIAFHGTTHDAFTGFAGPAALNAAIAGGLGRMAAEGLGRPVTLIYPFGRHNRWVREAVSTSFDSAFTTWFGLNQGEANRYGIRRIPFGAYTGKLPATEAWYRGIVERCAAEGGWPTLMLHPAAEGHTRDHDALLGRLVDHARACGMAVRTVAAHLGGAMPAAAAAETSGTPGARGTSA
ncbi:MAG: polysaccharide deacetylase family protein, partial [Rubrivivax sp.]|nr:polysaccharide deacetylase family protein [Rubrivivax sp.]